MVEFRVEATGNHNAEGVHGNILQHRVFVSLSCQSYWSDGRSGAATKHISDRFFLPRVLCVEHKLLK